MWEFNDPDLGYSFGKPLVTKTNAFGKKWLVVVSSGYNNPSGEGKLWFLDAKDGTVLKVLSTGVGSAGTPSGLAQFSAYTQDPDQLPRRPDLRRRPAGQLLALRRL